MINFIITACPNSKYQTDQTEARPIQKRALNIFFTCTTGVPYSNAQFLAGLASLTAYVQVFRLYPATEIVPTSLPHSHVPHSSHAYKRPLKSPHIFHRPKK